jgi:hypothetical protein
LRATDDRPYLDAMKTSHALTLLCALSLALSAAMACDALAQCAPSEVLAVPEGAPREALEHAATTLRVGLEASGAWGAPIELQVLEAGEGLYIVRAIVPGSYPGTGVRSVVVDADGVSYGLHGTSDLAELARARGWLAAPPEDVRGLLRLLDAAYFEGMGAATLTEPGVVAGEGGLTVHFDEFRPPGPTFPWRALLPNEGPTQLFTVDHTGTSPDGMRQVR